MRVLVTGGAGFIGATTAATLIEQGHDVTVLDNLSSGRPEAVPEEAEFIRGDVTDRMTVDRVISEGNFQACIHFAALIEAGESMHAPERYFEINCGGSSTLIRALVDHGVGRFVLSSTAAVYGDPETLPIDESAPVAPTNAYGESKLSVERMLRWLRGAHDFRTARLRYFNAAGATPGRGERHRPETHLIPLVLEVASGQRGHVTINGADFPTPDGTAVRDYVHVSDLAQAHVRALDALATERDVLCNLGNGEGHSVLQVIDAAREVTGHPIPTVINSRRAGDPATLIASNARAHSLLDWHPKKPDLREMILDAWVERARSSAVTV